MATNKHPTPCEVNNSGALFLPLSCVPGTFCPDDNVSCSDSAACEMDPYDCIAAIPIRSLAPSSECEKEKVMDKPKEVKKKKFSGKDSHQNASIKLKPKMQKKGASDFKVGGSEHFQQRVKKNNPTEVHNVANFDFSMVPPPVCSCTGVARLCYRCGTSGWQSSCCTRTMSEYPLPLRPLKPGVRLGGRKMTTGAYTKLLCRLATAGTDLSRPIDLKNHWAKLGTNKFVTIK